jgi:transcription initiation factor IIF auxiliary subunit
MSNIQMRNRWKYKPKAGSPDWWEWEVFLDDRGSGEVANVDFVEYVLHPTFTPATRKVKDPTGAFALKDGAWGGFTVDAFIHMIDGSTQKVRHMIELKYEPSEGVSRTTRESTNELQRLLRESGFYDGPIDGSYGRRTAEAVRTFQREQGLEVDGFAGVRTWDALMGRPRRK